LGEQSKKEARKAENNARERNEPHRKKWEEHESFANNTLQKRHQEER
jgi:hypothetical protein